MLNVPLEIRRSWSYLETLASQYGEDDRSLMYPSFILELRDVLTRQPLISAERLAERASLLREKTEAEAAFVEARKRKADRLDDSKYKHSSKRQREAEREVDKSKLQFVRRAGRMDLKERLKNTQEEYLRVLEKLKQQAIDGDLHETSQLSSVDTASRTHQLDMSPACANLLQHTPYAGIRIGNTASTKLNYIIREASLFSFQFWSHSHA